jgi:hypothetical protein
MRIAFVFTSCAVSIKLGTDEVDLPAMLQGRAAWRRVAKRLTQKAGIIVAEGLLQW